MKERLINNLGLKILSIFVAFLVWLVVVNVSNPEVVRSKDVTLEIENEQVLLSAKKTYEISGKSTVSVSYEVRTRDEYRIKPSDFRAYIDLSELYSVTGSVPVKVEVLNNKELISNATAKPGVVHVETEDLQTKRFSLTAVTEGETEDGYAPNGITISPDYVTVQGPTTKVGQISYAGIEIDVSGLSTDKDGTEKIVFYDANGSSIEISDRIKTNISEVQYHVVINKVKQLPLEYRVSGDVASGYRYTGAEGSKRTVSVIGPKSSLASVNTLIIPAETLNLDGANQDRVITVDVSQYLPSGVQLAESEDPRLEVRLKVERLVTRTITLQESDVTGENGSSELIYRFQPSKIEVTVRGLEEDLDSLKPSDLNAFVNLDGMQPGTHPGRLVIEETDVFSVVSHSEFQVEVSQRTGIIGAGPKPQESTDSPELSSSEGQTQEEKTEPETEDHEISGEGQAAGD